MVVAYLFILISSIIVPLFGQYFNPPHMGGSMGCIVTGNKLFSHGNFIRDLNENEQRELKKYKRGLAEFKKKIDDAFNNADNIEKSNSTIPPMPIRPSMPSFCSKGDTTLYIFSGCIVQNYKVYVGGKYARDLSLKEKNQLNLFIKQMSGGELPQPPTSTTKTVDVSSQTPILTTSKTPAMDKGINKQIKLDFCMEF